MKLYKQNGEPIGMGQPAIIVPIMETTQEKILKEIDSVRKLRPDIIEWRADQFENIDDLEDVLRLVFEIKSLLDNTLLLFTFRTVQEGGNKIISKSYYIQVIKTAILSKKVDLVDVELLIGEEEVADLVHLANENGVEVVISNHEFTNTPRKEEILTRIRKMQELGASISKIAVMPKNMQDVITLLDTSLAIKTEFPNRLFIAIAMGELGVISRIACGYFGSCATFAAGLNASAPGQIPVDEIKQILQIMYKND